MSRLGYLDKYDPLFSWFKGEIYPKLGLTNFDGQVEVYSLEGSNTIYLYKAIRDGSEYRIVGKFYGKLSDSNKIKRFLLMKEVMSIRRLEKLGFDSGSYRVVKCLGYNEYINFVFATEYVEGKRLDKCIKDAVLNDRRKNLYQSLSKLAKFLYLLHSRSIDQQGKVDFGNEYAYFHKTLSRLKSPPLISSRNADTLHDLAHRWKHRSEMWLSSPVLVHGDCTPTNFIFLRNQDLIALDLERSRRSDSAFDTGRVAGELKHNMMLFTGDGEKAEPFIHHFYKEYCSNSSSSTKLFQEITARNPFYQATTELRIAKNSWVSPEHRKKLIDEAIKCLK